MDGLHPSPLSRPPQECCPPSSSRARLQYEPFAKAHHLNTDPAPERPPNRKSTKSEYKNHHKPSLSQLRNDPPPGEGRKSARQHQPPVIDALRRIRLIIPGVLAVSAF